MHMNNNIMRNISYGLFILTAKDGDKPNGCVINTLQQVTTDPNRITITVNKANYIHDMILKTGEFNVSILNEDAKFDTFKHFGFQSGRDVDKFRDFPMMLSENGLPYITEGSNGFISGKVVQTIDLGTHTMFIADAVDGDVTSDIPSATYAYYHKHIKEAPAKETSGWVCTICGYVYKGDVLPDDFICPICKHPASDFKKL